MRRRFGGPPARTALETLSLHEIVRDWPESLAVFSGAGVSVARHGTERLPELDGDGTQLIGEVERATRWRATASQPDADP